MSFLCATGLPAPGAGRAAVIAVIKLPCASSCTSIVLGANLHGAAVCLKAIAVCLKAIAVCQVQDCRNDAGCFFQRRRERDVTPSLSRRSCTRLDFFRRLRLSISSSTVETTLDTFSSVDVNTTLHHDSISFQTLVPRCVHGLPSR